MAIRPLIMNSGPGGAPVTGSYSGLEGANQSFTTNTPLIASGGRLITALANGTSEGIIGLSTQGASGTTDTEIGFAVWQPGSILEGNLDDALDGDNAPGTHALAVADIYTLVGVVKDAASGHWYFDEEATDDEKAVIIKLVDPVGTVQGRVRAMILGTADATGVVRGSLFT